MNNEVFLQLGLSLLFGAIIGFEREYRSKAAGFRTITLITLGSTLFTILSINTASHLSDDRIAAQIVTGIGFIGAGVIFKDGFAVSGLTTAASIWIAAAVGLALGFGSYAIASFTLLLTMIILALFEKVQDLIDSFHQVKTYRIVFHHNDYLTERSLLEERLSTLKLNFKVKRNVRTDQDVIFYYNVAGSQTELDRLNDYLVTASKVKSFDE